MRINEMITDVDTIVAKALTKDFTKKTKKLSKQIATRQTSNDMLFSAIMGVLPNPDPILKALGKDMEVYEDLSYDSRVQAVVKSRKSSTKKRKWDIVGDGSTQTEIDFHKNRYKNVYNVNDIISEALDYFWYGYKVLEIVWNVDTWEPANLVGKPSRWFSYDDSNKLRFLSNADSINGVKVPDNKFIVARNEATYDNPYGNPVASPCYWPVIFRKSGLSFWFTLVEKYGIPWIMTKYEESTKKTRIVEVCDILEESVQDAIVATPNTWETELINGNANQGKNDSMHKTFLDFNNTEIAMAVLGNNLTTEVQGGSYAATSSHMEVREDITDSDSDKIEEVFNEEIKITHSLHFTTQSPKFHLYKPEKIDITRADRDLKIQQGNPELKFTKKYYRDKYNLEEDEFELIKVQNKDSTSGEKTDASKQ